METRECYERAAKHLDDAKELFIEAQDFDRAAMSTSTTEMRLACVHCDCDEADGVTEIPPGWEGVEPVECTDEDDSMWWTHLGTCPNCARAGQEECRKRDAIDARRFRKLMDLAAYGGTWQSTPKAPIEHVWRFRPIMGPHKNLLDAIDGLGET